MDIQGKKILLTGGAGFLGKYVFKKLIGKGVREADIFIPRSSEYDLREKNVVDSLVKNKDIVIHLAAKVGGLWYHVGRQAELFYDNAIMGLNLVNSSYKAGVKKFIGLGSVCEYPDNAPIPFKEYDVWN